MTYAQQRQLEFSVRDMVTGLSIERVELYDSNYGLLGYSDSEGKFSLLLREGSAMLTLFSYGYDILELELSAIQNGVELQLSPIFESLTEVEVVARNAKIFSLKRLKDYEGTSINSGKKNEVILLGDSPANLAANNARQIFSQVPGLNIFQNDDAGLQLNIGGRGLNPNRTSNFNTRQNGYDISADVLGYPESYYTPPAEALNRIEIIRGAASLQYGTQFGGLVNFIFKAPNKDKILSINQRNTYGSFDLFTNFTELSGTNGKLSHYSFYNYKKGSGFRSNSEFESSNAHLHIKYAFDTDTHLSAELTYLYYLAQQGGGLSDDMFNENPFQSIRARNWFAVDWLLYNVKFEKRFNKNTNFLFQFFGLDATRKALGFRVNRVSQIDSNENRDLIVGDFKNYGLESKLLSEYKVFDTDAVILLGLKYYKSYNTSDQGPGSANSDADFGFYSESYPYYPYQSSYRYPNTNMAFFGENVFKFNDKLSVTPGFRLEYINTRSEGSFRNIFLDAAFNVLADETIYESRKNERFFMLSGIGVSYKQNPSLELYLNLSQNYRSVTFADISTINPTFAIDPNIEDESGFNFDVGTRGNFKELINYDISGFILNYDNRIGFIQKELDDGNVKAYRTNAGRALIYGVEGVVDLNLRDIFSNSSLYSFNLFSNISFINSEYVSSYQSGVEGKRVEFIPNINLKTGIKFGYKNFTSYLQYTYLSDQFSDASNAVESNLSGVIGLIPAYDVMDFSLAYNFKQFKLECGLNNVLNNTYFTRRAKGYPGPGIIPSPPRNYYITLRFTN